MKSDVLKAAHWMIIVSAHVELFADLNTVMWWEWVYYLMRMQLCLYEM